MKRNITLSSLIAAALILGAFNSFGQTAGGDRPHPPGGGGPRGGGPRGGSPIMKALDVNKDGKIDAAELANASAALAVLDLNKDGQITSDEYHPQRPAGAPAGPGPKGGHPPVPSPLLAALDTNGDGIISADELANATAALKALDKNGDGELTKDEIHGPGPGPGAGGPRGHRGHPPGNPPGQE